MLTILKSVLGQGVVALAACVALASPSLAATLQGDTYYQVHNATGNAGFYESGGIRFNVEEYGPVLFYWDTGTNEITISGTVSDESNSNNTWELSFSAPEVIDYRSTSTAYRYNNSFIQLGTVDSGGTLTATSGAVTDYVLTGMVDMKFDPQLAFVVFEEHGVLRLNGWNGTPNNSDWDARLSLYEPLSQVPLPAGGVLLLSSLAAFGVARRRKQKAS